MINNKAERPYGPVAPSGGWRARLSFRPTAEAQSSDVGENQQSGLAFYIYRRAKPYLPFFRPERESGKVGWVIMEESRTETAEKAEIGVRKLRRALGLALFGIAAASALVWYLRAASPINRKDQISNMAANGAAAHQISFNLSGANTFTSAEQIALRFPASFTQTATWDVSDFTFTDGTARTILVVNAGAGASTVSCTNGANNLGVALDTSTLTFRFIPCGAAYTTSAAGAYVTLLIDGQSPNGQLKNPATPGSYVVNILDGAGDCGSPSDVCGMAIAIADAQVTVTAAVAASAVCGNGIIELGEGCDDGNVLSGDGCAFNCQIESGYACSGQPSVCTPAGGGGGGAQDTTPPVISGIACSGQTETSFNATWTTNEGANSLVRYGLTASYGSTASDAGYLASHSVPVTGLVGGTTYHYQVCSTDPSGNQSCSTDQSCTTLDLTPPVLSGLQCTAIGSTSFTATWTTDENASTWVDYGLVAGPPYASTDGAASPLSLSHSVTLTGLASGTSYYYRARSMDASANEGISGALVCTTSAPADTTSPVISGIQVTGITGSSATVGWTTDENASTWVDYGLVAGPPYASTDGAASPLSLSHSVTLTGLTSSTVYHFRVRSADAAANQAASTDMTFTTADVTPPVISSVQVSGITPYAATVSWTTNENSDSRVDYGTTVSYGANVSSASMVTAHQVNLTGLLPNMAYHYKVTSADASANSAATSDFTFTTTIPPPPVISGITVTNITQTAARVNWTTNVAASSVVNYGLTVSYGTTVSSSSDVTSHLVGLSGLTKNTTYHYRVRSADQWGQETVSTTDLTFKTLADTTPPANVSNFTAVAGDAQVQLSWTNPTDLDFVGTRVIRKTGGYPTSTTDGTLVYSGTLTSQLDTNVSNGIIYYYAAFAFDDVPNYASGALASATPQGPQDVTPPGDATNFTAVPGDGMVTISWTNPGDADFRGVRLLRKTSGPPTGPTDGSVVYEGTANTRVDAGLTNGTLYYYAIYAFDAVPNWSSGVQATATPQAPADVTPPGPVTNLSATAGAASVQLAWTNPADIDWAGTRVVRKAGSVPANRNDGTIVFDGVGDNRLDTTVTNGTTYHYCAYAYDASSNFAAPACVSATPLAALPPPPPPSCIDSDGGKIYEVQGSVTAGGTTNADSCADSNTVTEWYCAVSAASSENHPCGGGYKCSAGRCVVDTFSPGLAVCGNGTCEQNENSLNCPADCPVAPVAPPVVPVAPTVAPFDPKAIQFYATAARIRLRLSGLTLNVYDGMTMKVYLPDAAIPKTIKSAFVNFAGASYAMRQTASYETDLVTPPVQGDYPLQIILNYEDGTSEAGTVTVHVVGRGRVLETGSEGGGPISGARVTLYEDKGGGNYGFWDGAANGQSNPQVTGDDGRYAFIAKPGTYKLVAEKDGYLTKETLPFPFDLDNVITNTLVLIRKPPPPVEEIKKIVAESKSTGETVQKVAAVVAQQATYVQQAAAEQVKEVVDNPIVEQQVQTVAAPTVVAVAVANVAAAGAATATAVPYALYLYSLVAHPFLLIARRRRKKWGTVYNALSKLPLDLAIVRLMDAKTGRILRTMVTDKEGRYFFIVQPGKYKLAAVKPGYVFPTVYLKGQKDDAKFVDLYHGEEIDAQEETSITANIPLDPVAATKTPRRVIWEGIGRRFQGLVGYLAILGMAIACYVTPTPIMFGLFAMNVVMFVAFRRMAIGRRPKSWGIVYDDKTGKPIQNAVARISESKFNKLLETQVTDNRGRYAFLVGSNVYYVTFEKPGYQKEQKGPVGLQEVKKREEKLVAVDIRLKRSAAGTAPVVTAGPGAKPPAPGTPEPATPAATAPVKPPAPVPPSPAVPPSATPKPMPPATAAPPPVATVPPAQPAPPPPKEQKVEPPKQAPEKKSEPPKAAPQATDGIKVMPEPKAKPKKSVVTPQQWFFNQLLGGKSESKGKGTEIPESRLLGDVESAHPETKFLEGPHEKK